MAGPAIGLGLDDGIIASQMEEVEVLCRMIELMLSTSGIGLLIRQHARRWELRRGARRSPRVQIFERALVCEDLDVVQIRGVHSLFAILVVLVVVIVIPEPWINRRSHLSLRI